MGTLTSVSLSVERQSKGGGGGAGCYSGQDGVELAYEQEGGPVGQKRVQTQLCTRAYSTNDEANTAVWWPKGIFFLVNDAGPVGYL